LNTNTLRLPLPITLGLRFGRAIDHDVVDADQPARWPGLARQYEEKASKEGLEPGSHAWETMVHHAKEAFWVALYDMGINEPT